MEKAIQYHKLIKEQTAKVSGVLERAKEINKHPLDLTRREAAYIQPEVHEDLVDRVARNDFSPLGYDKEQFEADAIRKADNH